MTLRARPARLFAHDLDRRACGHTARPACASSTDGPAGNPATAPSSERERLPRSAASALPAATPAFIRCAPPPPRHGLWHLAREMLRRSRLSALLLTLPALLAGCGDDAASPTDDAGTTPLEDAGPPPADVGPVEIPEGWPKAECDALDPTACALPWPSSLYLEPSDATPTGHRLTFGATSLPRNGRRVHIAPALFEGLDGYGLGTPILFDLGPLDFEALPGEWDGLERSVEASSPTLLLERTADGWRRVPHFIEPDANALEGQRVTFLRPAELLRPSTRYAVILRDLRDPDGAPVPPSPAFAALRDGAPSGDAGVEARRDAFEALFAELEAFGVARDELILAWDFTTGSDAARQGRLDDAIARGLEAAPEGGALSVHEVEARARPGEGGDEDAHIRYTIQARMTVPSVLAPRDDEADGFQLALDADGRVEVRGERTVRVLVQVPHRALEGEPEGVIVYGHGLFGDENEVRAGHLKRLAEEQGYVLLGVPLAGMSGDDLEAVTAMTTDLNFFGVLADPLHQGILDHHLLARAALSGRLQAMLEEVDPAIAIDGEDVGFFGASQGGIFGQTILATAPDIRRAILAVPGNNYVTMLERSINFARFADLLRLAYARPRDLPIVLAAVQLLWDRTDPVSYVGRMVGEWEGASEDDPERDALFLVSKGDYQVAVLTNEVAARTFPEALPLLAPYDGTRPRPFALNEASYPRDGSGIVLFDFGNPWPSDRGNRPPDDGLSDPHSRIAEVDEAGPMIRTFLGEGRIEDICGGDGCTPR